MAKIQLDMNSVKNTKKDIQKNVKQINATLLDYSEDIIKETVKTGEAWQKLMTKAVKNSEPLMKKQSDIIFDAVKGMKSEAEYGVKRFEKLTGFDFSDVRKTFEVKVPTAPKWIKEGFEYITDQTEDILAEVSKKGDEITEKLSKRGEEIAETITDTAKSFAKEAEELKDKAESKVKETIKEVEERITDVAPTAGAAIKKVTSFILTDDKPTAKKAKAKKPVAKKATAKAATKKKPVAKKPVAKKPVAKAPVAKKATRAPKVTATKTPAPKAIKQTAPKTTNAPKTAPATKATTKGDDLKVIEGVGPKLEQLLIQAGFTSYMLLAKAEVSDLQKVLDAAGSRYKMHNPTSWPLQARFARDGKFDTLKSWQEKNDAQKA